MRNAGDETIPDLVVTVRGFTDRAGGARDADRGRDLWIVDDGPGAARDGVRRTRGPPAASQPGRAATLRWRVTPVVAGTHTLRYAIAPALAGAARAQLARRRRPARDAARPRRPTRRPARASIRAPARSSQRVEPPPRG